VKIFKSLDILTQNLVSKCENCFCSQPKTPFWPRWPKTSSSTSSRLCSCSQGTASGRPWSLPCCLPHHFEQPNRRWNRISSSPCLQSSRRVESSPPHSSLKHKFETPTSCQLMAALPPPDIQAPIKRHHASPQTPFPQSISAFLTPSHLLDELRPSSLYIATALLSLQLPRRVSPPVSIRTPPSPFPPTHGSIFPTGTGRLVKLRRELFLHLHVWAMVDLRTCWSMVSWTQFTTISSRKIFKIQIFQTSFTLSPLSLLSIID
jgi:hypothetical protein